MAPLSQKDAANLKRSQAAQTRQRDSKGHFLKNPSLPTKSASHSSHSYHLFSSPKTSSAPPLISLEVENPITYLKLWWKKVIANEGIDFRFRIRPLTALSIAAVMTAGGFSIGRFTLPPSSPIIKYIPQLAPTPTPNLWRDTAYSGLLKQTGSRFYLLTQAAEAVTLEVPPNVNLTKLVGKRIFATGRFNIQTGILHVTDASDMEILVQVAPIPTTIPSLTPTPPSPSPTP